MQRTQDVSIDKAKWNPSVVQSGAAAPPARQHQVWTIEPADPGLHGENGRKLWERWGRGSEAARSEVRKEAEPPGEGLQELEQLVVSTFSHWGNCELCPYSASLMTFLNLATLPRHVLLCLTCWCLLEVHTPELIEARSDECISAAFTGFCTLVQLIQDQVAPCNLWGRQTGWSNSQWTSPITR